MMKVTMASKRKMKYILFWLCIFLPLFHIKLANGEKISNKNPEVFSTWEGFELDKCASIWLIQNFIYRGVKIKFFPKGTINMEGVPFDVPEAKFRRYHNMSTFESLLEYHKQQDPIISFDDFSLNPVSHEVSRAGKSIEMSAKEYTLLEFMVYNADCVLNRVTLSEHVWKYDFDRGTNFIDVYINRLRNKIDKGYKKKFIYTVRGYGYMFKT